MDKDVLERARWFSWRRQRLDRTCRGVEDCLQSVIGVYSVNPSGPLSLLARVPRLLKGAAVEGVIGTKRAVRIPAMRRQVFMVPTEMAPAILAATRQAAPYRLMLKRAGIDEDEYKRLRREVLLAAGFPKTAEQIADAVTDAPDDIGPMLQTLCAEGSLLRIKSPTIRSNTLTYAAAKVWLGEEFKKVPQDEALRWLAGEYLTAFGPARVDDFVWWTGLKADLAGKAFASIDAVEVDKGVLLHRRDQRAFDGTRQHTGRVNLLPKLDCYTMGYAGAGRARFVHPSLLVEAYDGTGDSKPIVLVEGQMRGTWSFRFSGTRITISMSMYETPGPKLRTALDDEANLMGSFLEASATRIEREKVARPQRTLTPKLRSKPMPPRARAAAKRPSRSGSTPRRTRRSSPRRSPRA